jgi:DNA-binding IclR family transcriptional regulator
MWYYRLPLLLSKLRSTENGLIKPPTQIASKIGYHAPSYVNLPLKSLMREGLVKKKPDARGQYRLTPGGVAIKDKFVKENKEGQGNGQLGLRWRKKAMERE